MRPVFLTGSLGAVGRPRRSTEDKSNGRLVILLKAVCGCAEVPFGLACTGLSFVEEAWVVGGAPTAGEALELGFALGVPAALGPLAAAALVAVKGIAERIVAEDTCRGGRAGKGVAWSRLRQDYVAAIVWRSFTQHWEVGCM